MTGSDNNPPPPPQGAEALASQRGEIQRQISATHSELAKALAQLGSGDASRIQIALQLTNLSALSQQVGTASEAALQRMQGEVTAAITAAQSLADAGGGNGADTATPLAVANAKARQTAQDFVTDFYEKREFDKYLKFKSDEDERAYREREEERQKEIEAALAEKSTAGNAHALQLEKEQLKDAGDHGADKSPDYQPSMDKLDAQINALDVAAARTDTAKTVTPDPVTIDNKADQQPSFQVDPNIMAVLKGAKVTVADQSEQGHGVSVDQSRSAPVRTV